MPLCFSNWHFIMFFQKVVLIMIKHNIVTLILPITVPTEREVINKERASGMYQLSAYYLAKITSEVPLMIIFPTIHFNIYYWFAGLNSYVGAYFSAWSIILLVTFVGQVIINVFVCALDCRQEMDKNDLLFRENVLH